MRRVGNLLTLATTLAVLPDAASAGTCALCRQALVSGGSAGLIQGFYWSIILIAGVPLVIIATVGIVAWRHTQHRRTSQHLQAMGRAINA